MSQNIINLDVLYFPPTEAVRQALSTVNSAGVTQREIYDQTGLGQPWQQAFREGRTKEPGYSHTVRLIKYLVEHHKDILSDAIVNISSN